MQLLERQTKTRTCEKHGDYTVDPGASLMCPICRDEHEERKAEQERQRYTEGLRRVGIGRRFENATIDNFEASTTQQQAALDAAREFLASPDHNLIFCGKVGTGKSHLAMAVAHARYDAKRAVLVYTVAEFISRIRETWRRDSKETEDGVFAHLGGVNLLVLDEVGATTGTDREMADVFRLIDTRYKNMLPTIICSNLDLAGLKAALGERAIDRLREGGGQLVSFNWESYRCKN